MNEEELNKEKLTVIVAAYNVEKYIGKCLESLIKQKYNNLEILVVNDGSSDKTREIIKKYEEKHRNIKLLDKENGGLSSARNFGIERATGEYITFVDGDDYLDENAYEEIMKFFSKEKSELCVFGFKKIYPNNKVKKYKINNELYKENFLKILFSKHDEISIVVWNKIFKRDIIEKNKIEFKNKAFFEDVGFIFKYLYFVKKISILNTCFYNYIQHENSITKSYNPIIVESAITTINTIREFYKEKDIDYSKEIEDMDKRLNIYTYNYYLKNGLSFNLKKEKFKEIFKSKIPLKHKLILILIKLKLYDILYKIWRKNDRDI